MAELSSSQVGSQGHAPQNTENLKVLVRDFDQASSTTGAAANGSRIQAGANDNADGVDSSQVQGSNLWIRREEPDLVDEAALGAEGGQRAGTT